MERSHTWQRRPLGHILLLLLMFSGLFSAPLARVLDHRGGVILPLGHRPHKDHGEARQHDAHRRKLLGQALTPLHGSVLEGYFYVDVEIGTPGQSFALIVDTGSTNTYVPCSSCTHCGNHQDPRFLPQNSSTYEPLGCQAAMCNSRLCSEGSQCMFSGGYAEGSSSSGLVGLDVLQFLGESTFQNPKVVFGCETRETGDLYTQQADGIMGLGKGPLAVVSQLAAAGAMEDVFSLCYGSTEGEGSNNGALIIGADPIPQDMQFTPMDTGRRSSPYYLLTINNIAVNGQPLSLGRASFGQGYGNVLDSGTTFTYLPPSVFPIFLQKLKSQVELKEVPGPDPEFHDICFGGAPTDITALEDYFPKVEFLLANDVSIAMAPENFLFRHKRVPGAYCLGIFANGEAGSLIGGISTRNLLVRYDRAGNRLGFARRKCSELAPRTADSADQQLTANSAVGKPKPTNPTGGDVFDGEAPAAAVGVIGSIMLVGALVAVAVWGYRRWRSRANYDAVDEIAMQPQPPGVVTGAPRKLGVTAGSSVAPVEPVGDTENLMDRMTTIKL